MKQLYVFIIFIANLGNKVYTCINKYIYISKETVVLI